MALATGAPVQRGKAPEACEKGEHMKLVGGDLDTRGPRQRLQGLYLLIRLIGSTPVCVARLRFFDGYSHRGEARLTRKRVS